MRIEFHYEVDFKLSSETLYSDWVTRIISHENASLGNLAYIFCDDNYLLKINQEHLKHDTLTDIITFDYTENSIISGDIFVSIDRIKENASEYGVSFDEEIHRVMSHGLLHLLGYNDKSSEEKDLMRNKENEMMELFHVEQ